MTWLSWVQVLPVWRRDCTQGEAAFPSLLLRKAAFSSSLSRAGFPRGCGIAIAGTILFAPTVMEIGVYANEDSDRVLPVDVLREMEKEGKIGELHHSLPTLTARGASFFTASLIPAALFFVDTI